MLLLLASLPVCAQRGGMGHGGGGGFHGGGFSGGHGFSSSPAIHGGPGFHGGSFSSGPHGGGFHGNGFHGGFHDGHGHYYGHSHYYIGFGYGGWGYGGYYGYGYGCSYYYPYYYNSYCGYPYYPSYYNYYPPSYPYPTAGYVPYPYNTGTAPAVYTTPSAYDDEEQPDPVLDGNESGVQATPQAAPRQYSPAPAQPYSPNRGTGYGNQSNQPQQQTHQQAAAPPAAEKLPLVVLVYRDQHVETVSDYAIIGSTLWDVSKSTPRKIPLSSLDMNATMRANDERGVDFRIPVQQGAK